MKYFIIMLLCVFTSCRNKEEIAGKTKKGELMSPCVGNASSPCSDRFNPNYN